MSFDELQLRQVDAALAPAQALRPPPTDGWIRTVRETLGMSIRQLARRAGLSSTTVRSVEMNEARGKAQLDSISRLARAMDCELVYAVVPRGSLAETLDRQAKLAAERIVNRVHASMEIEAQGTSANEREQLRDELARKLRGRLSELWDASAP